MLRTDAGFAEHAYEMDTSELHRTRILMAALALPTTRSMNPGDLAEAKPAPAERIETMEMYTRGPADNLMRPKTLDRDGPDTEVLSLGEEIVTDVTTLVGRGASRFMPADNPEQADASYGQLIVRATDATLIPDVAARLNRELLAQFPNALIRVEEIVFGPPAGADVAGRVSGPDPVVLRQLSADTLAIFDEAGTITNPRTDWRQREILV